MRMADSIKIAQQKKPFKLTRKVMEFFNWKDSKSTWWSFFSLSVLFLCSNSNTCNTLIINSIHTDDVKRYGLRSTSRHEECLVSNWQKFNLTMEITGQMTIRH